MYTSKNYFSRNLVSTYLKNKIKKLREDFFLKTGRNRN